MSTTTVTGRPPRKTTPGPPGQPLHDLAYLRTHCGLSNNVIGRKAGISGTTLTVIAGGETVGADTAARLHTIRLAWTPPPGHVLAYGATRRLQALAYIGHPPARLAEKLGRPAPLVWEWTTGEHRFMPQPVVPAVDRIYQQLCVTPGPNPSIADYARTHGWVSALAWDEGTIDDPRCRPNVGRRDLIDTIVDPVAVDRALTVDRAAAARLTLRERYTAIRLGIRSGLPPVRLSALLGCTERSALRPTRTSTYPTPSDPFAAYYTTTTQE